MKNVNDDPTDVTIIFIFPWRSPQCHLWRISPRKTPKKGFPFTEALLTWYMVLFNLQKLNKSKNLVNFFLEQRRKHSIKLDHIHMRHMPLWKFIYNINKLKHERSQPCREVTPFILRVWTWKHQFSFLSGRLPRRPFAPFIPYLAPITRKMPLNLGCPQIWTPAEN